MITQSLFMMPSGNHSSVFIDQDWTLPVDQVIGTTSKPRMIGVHLSGYSFVKPIQGEHTDGIRFSIKVSGVASSSLFESMYSFGFGNFTTPGDCESSCIGVHMLRK